MPQILFKLDGKSVSSVARGEILFKFGDPEVFVHISTDSVSTTIS